MINRLSPNAILWSALALPIATAALLQYLADRGSTLVCEVVEREMGCLSFGWVTTAINATYLLSSAAILFTLLYFPFATIKKHGWAAVFLFTVWFLFYVWASYNWCHEC